MNPWGIGQRSSVGPDTREGRTGRGNLATLKAMGLVVALVVLAGSCGVNTTSRDRSARTSLGSQPDRHNPLAAAQKPRLAWTTAIGPGFQGLGTFRSEVVVAVAVAVEPDSVDVELRSVDGTDGRVRWTTRLRDVEPAGVNVRVMADGVLATGLNRRSGGQDQRVTALDGNGEERWSHVINGQRLRLAGAVVVLDPLVDPATLEPVEQFGPGGVHPGLFGDVVALDVLTGQTRWTRGGATVLEASADLLLLASAAGFEVVEADTGRRRFTVNNLYLETLQGSMLLPDGRVFWYDGAGFSAVRSDGTLATWLRWSAADGAPTNWFVASDRLMVITAQAVLIYDRELQLQRRIKVDNAGLLRQEAIIGADADLGVLLFEDAVVSFDPGDGVLSRRIPISTDNMVAFADATVMVCDASHGVRSLAGPKLDQRWQLTAEELTRCAIEPIDHGFVSLTEDGELHGWLSP